MYDGDEKDPLLEGEAQRLSDYVDNEVRLGFIRKVYGILCAQLLLTVAFCLPFHTVPEVKYFVEANPWLFWLAFVMTLVLIFILICNIQAARSTPNNYILLFAFTGAEAFLIGVVTCQHSAESVVVAMVITCGIFLVLTLYACKTDADFTGYGIYLLVGGLVLFFMSIGMMIWRSIFGGLSWLGLIFHIVVILFFCFYIIYDTQLIIGGKHATYQFSVDDYVVAALCLYLDIITVFMHMLGVLDGD